MYAHYAEPGKPPCLEIYEGVPHWGDDPDVPADPRRVQGDFDATLEAAILALIGEVIRLRGRVKELEP